MDQPWTNHGPYLFRTVFGPHFVWSTPFLVHTVFGPQCFWFTPFLVLTAVRPVSPDLTVFVGIDVAMCPRVPVWEQEADVGVIWVECMGVGVRGVGNGCRTDIVRTRVRPIPEQVASAAHRGGCTRRPARSMGLTA